MQQRQDQIIYILEGNRISETFLSKSSFFFSSLGLPCPAWPLLSCSKPGSGLNHLLAVPWSFIVSCWDSKTSGRELSLWISVFPVLFWHCNTSMHWTVPGLPGCGEPLLSSSFRRPWVSLVLPIWSWGNSILSCLPCLSFRDWCFHSGSGFVFVLFPLFCFFFSSFSSKWDSSWFTSGFPHLHVLPNFLTF